MTAPASGWYPDPEQQDQLRYWDGQQWTPHRTPMPHRTPPSGHAQAAGLGQSRQPTGYGQAAGYGQPAVPGQPSGYSSHSGYGQQPGHSQPPGHPGQPPHDQRPPWEQQPAQRSSGRGLIIGLGLGIGLFLVLVVVLVVVIVSRIGADEDTTTTTGPERPQENPETLSVDDSVTVHVPDDAETRLQLSVEEAGLYHVATQSEQGTDPVLALQDADGTEIAFADDGGTDSPNVMDGGFETALVPGEYDVVVTKFSGDPAEVTVTTEQIAVAEQLEDGEHTVEAAADAAWLATVDVPDGARVVLDVRGDDGADLVLDVVLPDGSEERNDDRSVRDPESDSVLDPYLEFDVDEGGVLTIMVSGSGSGAASGTISIEVED
ncbi:DVUA0089 family protein [Nesterenkonia sp. PF2B19]|uniref:DVUA0089 family protein n=1 Tax=Nesterenkonia sp. PF2B19 TaxID=1881858 RepID=UPI0008726DC2|nr:DVUA0089 family protein [Nesterenkonia sp. PF2B19]OSM43618.1 hypothetical protein BCY76_007250 [Nesterenkonia sp. PF2B19]